MPCAHVRACSVGHEQSPVVVVIVETLTELLLHRMVTLGTHQLFGGTLIDRDLLIWKGAVCTH